MSWITKEREHLFAAPISKKDFPAKYSSLQIIPFTNFRDYIGKNGIESFLLEIKVRWPIEKVAMKFMIAVLESDNTLVCNSDTLH